MQAICNRIFSLCALILVFGATTASSAADFTSVKKDSKIRPPCVPLIAHDPYFSIWSAADKLSDVETTHWTGKPQPLHAIVRIDGKAFRVMGAEPTDLPALPQKDLTVLPTRTVYQFANEQVAITLTFLTPALPWDLGVLSRPLTYIVWDVSSADFKAHEVQIYLDCSANVAVNKLDQQVVWSQPKVDGIVAGRIGTKDQQILAKKGDDLRIDWGHCYLAAPKDQKPSVSIGASSLIRSQFVSTGDLFSTDDPKMPRAANDNSPVIALRLDLGKFELRSGSKFMMLAYDDVYSIQYFKRNLRPYWRRNGAEAADLLTLAASDFTSLRKQCEQFDVELSTDLIKAGGEQYAQIAALAFRQTWAGNKIVADDNGQPLVFPKENFSNGCIATVDVIYPMAPQFLLFGPTLAKAIVIQNLDYATSKRWQFSFAPHDLGTYPLANGQVYGGGEKSDKNQMPVEECGNMLVLVAAIADMEGNVAFAEKYWPVLTKWANYLKEKGFDPENQLCTDDFAGHMAHNVNLSVKAICGLASYAKLAAMRGEANTSKEFSELAEQFARKLVRTANDEDHLRLAFDRPGTWSQKYNLVWDRILGFGLWNTDVSKKEMAFYKRSQKSFGLPLDSRKTYTKLDWTVWSATLTQNRADFDSVIAPVYKFVNETQDRVPMCDWYETTNGRKVGFIARPVVGGVFLPLLYDKAVWKKWSGRDRTKGVNWAPLPSP